MTMKSFASALTFVVGASAINVAKLKHRYSLPQYVDDYDPHYDAYTPVYRDWHPYVEVPAHPYKDPVTYPTLDATLSLTNAWAAPYYPSDYAKKENEKDLAKNYEDAKKIVQGVAHGYETMQKKIANEVKRMPHHPYVEPYIPPPMDYVMPMHPGPDYFLPVYEVVTPYEWY